MLGRCTNEESSMFVGGEQTLTRTGIRPRYLPYICLTSVLIQCDLPSVSSSFCSLFICFRMWDRHRIRRGRRTTCWLVNPWASAVIACLSLLMLEIIGTPACLSDMFIRVGKRDSMGWWIDWIFEFMGLCGAACLSGLTHTEPGVVQQVVQSSWQCCLVIF